jgi:FkbM family methyltransferase
MIKRIIKKLIGDKKAEAIQQEFDFDGEYYIKQLPNFKIYSHDKHCITSTYGRIFDHHIYNFNYNKDNPTIIDAGANIGLASLYLKNRFPKAKIIAFEPSRRLYKTLNKNISVNNLSDVECINVALSDKEGEASFTDNAKISGSLITEKNLAENYTVKTDLLSKYIKEPIDFLKMDIEGAEMQVFPEIQDKLSLINNMFIEYHSFTHLNQDLSKILALLEKNNFRYYIEGEYIHEQPLVKDRVSLGQDLQVNIWANKI